MSDTKASATSDLKIIPTPRKSRCLGSGRKTYAKDKVYTLSVMAAQSDKLRFAATYLKRELQDKFGLFFQVQWGQMPTSEEDIVLYCGSGLQEETLPPGLELGVFEEKNAAEQGYVLQCAADQPVYLCAQSDQGAQYGITTLLELFAEEDGETGLPHILVEDYPQFRYRGNRWLLRVEMYDWGYDWGDGIGAYRQRIREKLDMALQAKVNIIVFEGFGWGVDVFPEYAPLMREFNRQARLRGIHLLYSGYGTGIAGGYRDKPHLYRGLVLENRKEYPHGAVYTCIAGERYCGTCLSNEALMELRLEELRRFVAEVEPGALYIHQQDEGLDPQTWTKRCPGCREKWPNDEVTAADGMAGAYAYLYNRLVETVRSVRNEDYAAAEQCLIVPISPGYLAYTMDDEDWQRGLQYWSTLSGLLQQRDKVFPCFREIFLNHGEDSRRVPQLQAALETNGAEQGYGIIYFYGADGHYNDKLFLATPALNYILDGVEMLVISCGHSYSEPLQLLNAEYMWNPHESGFFNLAEKPADYAGFTDLYIQCQYNQFKPAALYEDFLATACAKLYGKAAGAIMHEMFLIEGDNGEPPVPYLDNSGLIRGEVIWEKGGDGRRQGSVFEFFSWPCKDAADTKDRIRARIRQSLAATEKAAAVLEKGLEKDPIEESSRAYLRWYAASLAEGVRYVGYLDRYIGLANGMEAGRGEAIADQIDALWREVKQRRAYNKRSRLQPVDSLGGAFAGRDAIIDFIEANLDKMLAAINEGQTPLSSA
jgi:hypothetical protein